MTFNERDRVKWSSNIPAETISLKTAWNMLDAKISPESIGPEPRHKKGQDAFDNPDWVAWRKKGDQRKKKVDRVLLDAITSGALTVWVKENTGEEYKVPPEGIPEDHLPAGLFIDKTISVFRGDPLDEYQGAALFLKENDFDDFVGASEWGDNGLSNTAGAAKRCREWLVLFMREGCKEKPKATYREEAKTIFRVSGRAFNHAWAEAIIEVPNSNWDKPGPIRRT